VPDTDMAQGAERFTGRWWLPSHPRRTKWGVLIVQADGQLHLELDGALSTQPRRSHADEQSEYELIRGRVGIRDFTLYKCSDMGISYQGITPIRQTLHVQIAVDGLRVSSVDDLAFDAANIEIDLLHEWARWSKAAGNPVSKPYKNDPPGRERFVYDPVPKLSMVAHDITIDLISGIFIGGPVGHLKMDTSQIFYVKLAQPLALEDWHDLILRPLQNFVSFVSDQAAWINKVKVSHSARLIGRREGRYPAPVTIYGYWAKEDKERADNLTPSSFVVNLDDVVPVFERVLSNWLRLSRHFKDALTLFFGPRYANRMYVELSFLMLAQALEVFHRTKYPTATMIPPDEYERIRKSLITKTPKARRGLISTRLDHGNDRFFKNRILDLVAYAGPAVTKLVGQRPDIWANHVRNTRNDLTHWNPVRKGIEPGTQNFFDMQRQASILMKTILLRELGFSEPECARILAGNWEYRHARGPWWDVT
jgi:hypothetical protein